MPERGEIVPSDAVLDTTATQSAFPIVGVGASAGGIEALEAFFRGLPERPGLAVIVITHLNPRRESLLPEILARFTDMPVLGAEDGTVVRRDHVYVMGANTILGIEHGRLQLEMRGAGRNNKPVDVFLSALAMDQGEMAAGIILSGGGGDGTLGIKAIKERGGLTMAQVADGAGPQHAGMPDSAIATGLIDIAISADQMGAKLIEFVADLTTSVIAGAPVPPQALEDRIPAIYTILRTRVGHDFSGYKSRTVTRRIRRRMQVNGLPSVEAYVARLEEEPAEAVALSRDLLINVTSFFRDADAFASLAELVVPKLFEGRAAGDSVRIWVPGCATGEEVYSIAILLREHMDTLPGRERVQIFGTDIDERSLAIARTARYPAALLDGVSAARRERFFALDGGSYVIAKEVREMCIFSPHNLINDPPFSRVDLVSCRNLLIYFGPQVQSEVIPTFHYALRPGGLLFLGSAENVSQHEDLFVAVDKRQRIFSRRLDSVSTLRTPSQRSVSRLGGRTEVTTTRPLQGTRPALREAVEEQLLERFTPPYVVVTREGEVVTFSGNTGKYLEAPAGAPTRNLVTMARKTLRLDLRSAFSEAVETGRRVVRDGVAVESADGEVQGISLAIEPLNQRRSPADAAEPLYLVTFADRGPVVSQEEALSRVSAIDDDNGAQLERELRDTRNRLQSLIEEYETALGELQSANEELVSVNEEMQCSNEELQASQEELESVNEELQTVNAELHDKVDALDRANADLRNLFDITDVATVFLDGKLVIRSFTPAVAKVFNILPTDAGRPITDLAINLKLATLTRDIAAVYAGGDAVETTAERDNPAASYLIRIAPYRDRDHNIEGVVITFIDVTTLTRAEARQRVLIGELQHRTRNLLAIVQSVARQTLGKGGALGDFTARLEALGRVQKLVGAEDEESFDLHDIVAMEVDAVAQIRDGKVRIAGPPVLLAFQQVQTFTLVLHELCTNAVKHGALRSGPGKVEITWELQGVNPDRSLAFRWRETGVDDMQAPSHRGFGTTLIERASGFSRNTRSQMLFDAEGVDWRITMALPEVLTLDAVAELERSS